MLNPAKNPEPSTRRNGWLDILTIPLTMLRGRPCGPKPFGFDGARLKREYAKICKDKLY